MFAKIVVGFVLVSILPCESQRQQFVQVPFDEATVDTSHLAHPPARIPANQPFGVSDQQLQTDFQDQLAHNHRFNVNPIASPPRQHFTGIAMADQLEGSPFGGGFPDTPNVNQHRPQPTRAPQLRTPMRRRRPTTPAPAPTSFQISDFPARQQIQGLNFEQQATIHPEALQNRIQGNKFTEVMLIMPLAPPSPIASPPQSHSLFAPNSDYQVLNTPVARQREAPRSTNAFFAIEEPFLRPAQPALHRPVEVPNTPTFLMRAQPAVRAPIAPPPQPILHNRPLNQHGNLNSRFVSEEDFLIDVQPNVRIASPPVPSQQERPHSPPRAQQSLTQDQNQKDLEEKLFRQQAESAQYSFASQIDDTISGNQHQREEVRDGLAVKGMYSYSDGYVKRTVHYEADEKGYRVVKEEEQPLGDGPQTDPKGRADVSTFVGGNAVQYSITADDIQDPKVSRVSDQFI